MITTLTGANSFLLKAELDRLVNQFVKEYTDMGLQRLDGEEAEYDKIREALESLPFLASKKLVVLRSPSANKEFIEKAGQLLANLSDTTDVIIYEPKLDKRSVYYKFLKKNTEYQEFNEPDEYSLTKWLVTEAKRQNAAIQSGDAKYLVERVGANQLLLSNELAKLVAYDPKVTRATIDLLTEPTPQSTIFQLLDAAFAGDGQKTLKIYQEQRAGKIEPQAIVGMLAWQLHILALLITAGKRSDAEIASQAKINPFVVRKTRNIANHLTFSGLKELISRLLELDIKIKTMAIDPDDALQDFLLQLAQN